MEKEYNYKLFPSKEDQDRFHFILSELFLERSAKKKQELLSELEELQAKCGNVLKEAGVSQNLVEQIINKNGEMNGSNSENDAEKYNASKEERSQAYEELLDVIRKLEAKHETLSLGEDLERDANKAFDRQEKIMAIKRREQEVESTMTGEKISHEEMLSAYPFKQIRSIKGITETDVPELEEKQTVTGISEAPESLLDKVYPKAETPTEEEIASSPVLTDNSFFASDDELMTAIEKDSEAIKDDPVEETLASETPVLEEAKAEPAPESDGIALLDEIAKEKEEIIPETKDIVIPEEPKSSMPELNDENSLTYELINGVSLSDVAESAYYDKNTWNKLYELNKKTIDEKLRGIMPIERAKDDRSILSGTVIRVPFTLDVKPPEKQAAKKVA